MCRNVWTIPAVTVSLLISPSPSHFSVVSLSIFNRLIHRILIKEETGVIGVVFLTGCLLGKRDVILLAWYCRRKAMTNLICSGVCVYDSRSYSFLCIQRLLNIHVVLNVKAHEITPFGFVCLGVLWAGGGGG